VNASNGQLNRDCELWIRVHRCKQRNGRLHRLVRRGSTEQVGFRWSMAIMTTFLAAGSWLACAPEPRNVPCSNGGECQEQNAKFRYCLQNRCVECVAPGTCGDGRTCEKGLCMVRAH
jgi:hypothetical protein